jgi:hypothetical protein
MKGSHAGGFRLRRVHVAGPELPPPSTGCRACSRENYGPCTCPADCGWTGCTGAWRESHPVTREAVAAGLTKRAELTKQGAILTVPVPVMKRDPGPQADLGGCLIFRAVLHDQFMRREAARDGEPWFEQYARVWGERTSLPALLVPDYGLPDALTIAAEVITQAEETAEAEWLARKEAAAALAVCGEYTGRHSGGTESAA